MSQMSKKISFKKNQSLNKLDVKMDSKLKNTNLSSSVNDLRNKLNPTSVSIDSTMALEAEYIKSLQQQIYLLELENNHLRQQTFKATEIQPLMTAEAEKMLENLKTLQKKVNSLELELFRKEGHVDLLTSKIGQLTKKLDYENDKHGRERNSIISDTISSKNDFDKLERELSRKNVLIQELKDDLQRNSSNQQAAENKIELLRAQLQEEMAKARDADNKLAEKKSEMFSVDAKLRELEENYSRNNSHFHEKIKNELREEILDLKKKLSEASNNVQREQLLRNQLSEDACKLMKENSILNRQIIELQNFMEKERSLREKFDNRRHQDDTELNKLREREKELEFNLRKLQQELEAEKARVSRLVQEISKQDKVYSNRILDDTINKRRASEIDLRNISLEEENENLKTDKENLIEHINNLQENMQRKERELDERENVLREMESRIAKLENLKSLDETIQTKRWIEMEQTIDALKSQAKLMTSVPRIRNSPTVDMKPSSKWNKNYRDDEMDSYN